MLQQHIVARVHSSLYLWDFVNQNSLRGDEELLAEQQPWLEKQTVIIPCPGYFEQLPQKHMLNILLYLFT